MYGLSLITAATIEPVTLDEARKQVRVSADNTYFDEKLLRLIEAARGWVEQVTNRALINQTWEIKFDRWPYGLDPIFVPKAPLSSITHIKYYDTSNVEQTLATSVYKVIASREPGEVRLKNAQSWPSLWGEPDVVTVRFVAGYGATVLTVPEVLRQAILLLIGHWFDMTGTGIGSISKELEFALTSLLTSYAVGDGFHVYAA